MSLVDIILELLSHLSFLLFFRRLKKKKLIRAEVGYLQLCFQVMLIEITSADGRLSSLLKLVLVQNMVFNYNSLACSLFVLYEACKLVTFKIIFFFGLLCTS